ncbi:MAG: hypothetical protein KGJ55_02045 [Gammaproteobacteria bacterium]|nr:hypothetical protein [Gammaproteobacteria bacterium]
MQIKIEVDLSPEELRRFLGLPDVGGLQEDVVAFLRDKVSQAGEFDPAAFLKGNLESLRRNPALQRLLEGARARAAGAANESADEPAAEPPPRRPRTRRRR